LIFYIDEIERSRAIAFVFVFLSARSIARSIAIFSFFAFFAFASSLSSVQFERDGGGERGDGGEGGDVDRLQVHERGLVARLRPERVVAHGRFLADTTQQQLQDRREKRNERTRDNN